MSIEIHREGRILHLALNRPEKRNALNLELCRGLVGALETADADPEVGAIVLKGNGKAFCAGMDLQEVSTADPADVSQVHERLFTIGSRMRTPLIAGVHGAALAGGTGLVANAHIVIAAPDATFGLTEIRIGLWPVLIWRAVALAAGERRTVELALTGRIFGAEEALAYGLVSQIGANAEEIAQTVAGYSPVALRKGLDYVDRIRGKDWNSAGWTGKQIRHEIMAGEDFAEGVRAFRDKRTPRWPSVR